MRLRRGKVTSQYAIRYGITRAGRVGVGIYRDGRLAGWGLNESAAWASVQVSAA